MSVSDIETAIPLIAKVENQLTGFAQSIDGYQRQYLLGLVKTLREASGFLTRPESPEQFRERLIDAGASEDQADDMMPSQSLPPESEGAELATPFPGVAEGVAEELAAAERRESAYEEGVSDLAKQMKPGPFKKPDAYEQLNALKALKASTQE